jgi:hypothetical protein
MGAKRKLATDNTADWPEFGEWLLLARLIASGKHVTDEMVEAIYPLERAMEARPVVTERQLAMLVAIAVWHEENHFDMRNFQLLSSRAVEPVMHVMARRAAVALPEVPFKFAKGR